MIDPRAYPYIAVVILLVAVKAVWQRQDVRRSREGG